MERMGLRDVRRGKAARRNLVEQRLEQVMVRAVNERDARIGHLKMLAEGQPAETGAQHHDMEFFVSHAINVMQPAKKCKGWLKSGLFFKSKKRRWLSAPGTPVSDPANLEQPHGNEPDRRSAMMGLRRILTLPRERGSVSRRNVRIFLAAST